MNAVEIHSLSKYYKIFSRPGDRLREFFSLKQKKYHIDFWALRDIDLRVKKGSTLGIIGNNGAGKSTLLRLIAGITQPSSGKIQTEGSIASLLDIGAGLHLDFSGRDNIFMNCSILGMSRKETEKYYQSILDFSELGDFIDQPLRVYSLGMQIRLGFAIAVSGRPDILLIDDALAVGDRNFQQKCLAKIREIQERGCTIIMVTHTLPSLNSLCE